EWEELFKAAFDPPTGEARCKDAVRVTLLWERARHPEYTFTLPDEEIKITADGKGGKLGVGKLVVKEGGSGAIEVTLTLDMKCNLLHVAQAVTLKPAATRALAAPSM